MKNKVSLTIFLCMIVYGSFAQFAPEPKTESNFPNTEYLRVQAESIARDIDAKFRLYSTRRNVVKEAVLEFLRTKKHIEPILNVNRSEFYYRKDRLETHLREKFKEALNEYEMDRLLAMKPAQSEVNHVYYPLFY